MTRESRLLVSSRSFDSFSVTDRQQYSKRNEMDSLLLLLFSWDCVAAISFHYINSWPFALTMVMIWPQLHFANLNWMQTAIDFLLNKVNTIIMMVVFACYSVDEPCKYQTRYSYIILLKMRPIKLAASGKTTSVTAFSIRNHEACWRLTNFVMHGCLIFISHTTCCHFVN